MGTKILTFRNLFQAKIGGILNSIFFNAVLPEKDIPGYEFDSYANASTSRKTGFVAFYKKDGKKVFVKKHQYRFKDMDYLYILNEASILEMLKSHLGFKFKSGSGITINIANFLGSRDTGSSIYVATVFEKGTMLKNLPENEIISVLQSCIEIVDGLYEKLPKYFKNNTSKRGSLSFLLSFLSLGLKLSLRDPKNLPIFIECAFIFYKNYFSSLKEKPVTSIAHRDLSKENILYNKESRIATIVDWENAIVTDRLYDIATIPWLYSKSITEEKLIPFLLRNLSTIQSRRRFVAFAIYHAIQCISIYDKKSVHYRDVIAHTIKFKNRTAGLIFTSIHEEKKSSVLSPYIK